ncbi:MAG: hypothetical protein VKP62_03285 [Candidatus Sericytochromatia bacterium]|nr:hypothetical protein [Candidatus Sericytochromatia bacterium]
MAASRLIPFLLSASLVLAAGAARPVGAAPASVPAKRPSPYPSPLSGAVPQELVEELEEGARINWTTGQLTVSGLGVPVDRGAASFKRALSTRAARADAFRRLSAILELLRVDANTRVKDLAVIDDSLRNRLNDFIKAATVLETNHWPDGSTELVLGVDLRGDRGLMALVGPPPEPVASPSLSVSPTPAPSPTPSGGPTKPLKEIVTEPVNLRATYTALVVDARGLGAQPALLPGLRDKDGKPITFKEKSLKYLRDGADMDPSAGVNPLSLRAQRTQGSLRADLVLGSESSDQLKQAQRDKKLGPAIPLIILL